MEAASLGASGAGVEVVGVTAPSLFAQRSGANPHVTHEIETAGLTDRIGALTGIADGAIVLPGSIGTAAELVIAWNLNDIGRRNGGSRFPTVAVGSLWRELRDLLVSATGAHGEDIHLAADTEEAVSWLLSQPELA
jgi:predicted Rossmann-fold nucleotide-binding protein